MRFMVVCEGASDIPVLRAAAAAYQHEVEPLKPSGDATSGYERFGWREVLRWCTNHGGKAQLLLGLFNCDLLLVHMDTDIAVEMVPGYADKGLSRRQCCEAQLNKALGVGSAPSWCYYVLPTMATETWLLALHDNQTHPKVFTSQLDNYEDYPDPEQMLLAIGYKARGNRLDKSHALYTDYASELAQKIPQVRHRCAEFDLLCAMLDRSMR